MNFSGSGGFARLLNRLKGKDVRVDDSGKLLLRVEPLGLDAITEEAFGAAIAAVNEATGLLPYRASL